MYLRSQSPLLLADNTTLPIVHLLRAYLAIYVLGARIYLRLLIPSNLPRLYLCSRRLKKKYTTTV